jgi:hypothetical protein
MAPSRTNSEKVAGSLSWRPSPSLVISMIALFVALSGTAVALEGSNTVFSDDIVNGEVKTPDLDFEAVTRRKLDGNSVNSAKIVDGEVRTPDLGGGAATTPKIGFEAVTRRKLADDAVNSAKVVDGSLGTGDLGFALGAGGTTDGKELQPQIGEFTTVLSDSITLVDGGGGILSAAVEVEDDIADQQPTKVDLQILVDGIITPTMVMTETVASGATEIAGIVTPTMIGAGQHTIELQVRPDNEATIQNRSLTETILPFLPGV